MIDPRGSRARALLLPAIGFLLSLVPALAQSTSVAARLSFVDGAVQVTQGDQTIAENAPANLTLFDGMSVIPTNSGRAEIQFDDGSLARIAPSGWLVLNTLRRSGSGTETDVQLLGGLAYFEVADASASGSFCIHFGNATVTTSGAAVLRVNVDNAPGEVAVLQGSAHVVVGNADSGTSVDLRQGQSLQLNADDAKNPQVSDSFASDSWDQWNADRDQDAREESSNRTEVASNLPDKGNPAWSDLDADGTWYDVGGVGQVWAPDEAATPGWEPFANGYWVWMPRRGYVWVSSYRWGYMPYQCGAWNWFDGFGWGWAPGECNPWWGAPVYPGLNVVVGIRWYTPPTRPRLPVGILPGGPHRPGPNPVEIVHRDPIVGAPVPVRVKEGPVLIGGFRAQPIEARPIDRATARTLPAHTTNRPQYAAEPPRNAYDPTNRTKENRGFFGNLLDGERKEQNAPQHNGANPAPSGSKPATNNNAHSSTSHSSESHSSSSSSHESSSSSHSGGGKK